MKTIAVSIFALSLIASSHAATVFITNNDATDGGTNPLASNEGDAGIGLTNGTTNNGLDGDSTGDSTVLSLSADDGGGAITFTTVNTSGNTDLLMDSSAMGHGNNRWGNGQNWTFTLDQTISFDALDFQNNDNPGSYDLRSVAWKDDAAASGTGWEFTSDGTIGIFSLSPGQIYDFTTAGVSNVAAGTEIGFGSFSGANGGEILRSFTITPVPEPSSFALLAGCFGLTWIMIRRR